MEFICKKTYQAHDPDQWTGTDVGKFDQHGFSSERRFSFIKDNGQVISVPSKESVLYRSYWTTIKVNKTLLNETVKEIGIE